MANNETFSIYFYHGGRLVNVGRNKVLQGLVVIPLCKMIQRVMKMLNFISKGCDMVVEGGKVIEKNVANNQGVARLEKEVGLEDEIGLEEVAGVAQLCHNHIQLAQLQMKNI
ncbi:conserved hypothetical protein [Ricinus communis]|uniref:Uncharacterized protein n=1 Tax=Ricinus communis TaxID=3988 RepID=B9SZ28_RICCO|nr:conserved hypothetical protein [Ricinus communis]